MRNRGAATLVDALRGRNLHSSVLRHHPRCGIRGEADNREADHHPYRITLERLWMIEEVPAWFPTRNLLGNLAGSPVHQLADPALAARLVGVGVDGLINGADSGRHPPATGRSWVRCSSRSSRSRCGSTPRPPRRGSPIFEPAAAITRSTHRPASGPPGRGPGGQALA